MLVRTELVLVVLLAAAACTADARPATAALGASGAQGAAAAAAAGGRQLLQTPSAADCNRSVNHCEACRYQFYRGTVTKAICSRCAVGYNVANSGRACYCAPGFYTTNDTTVNGQVGFDCIPCGFNAYCPGARVTAASGAVRIPCGANKITTSDHGMSDRECVVQPGFGWGPGDSSAACPQGFYNPGYNTRRCTKCPGSLTTLGTNSNSTQDCLAPAGAYYLRGKAVACAQGTYKEYIGNNDCDICPTGFTTAAAGATTRAACQYILPGYEVRANGSASDLGSLAATECQESTYRSGNADWVAAGYAAVLCDACPNALRTLPNVTRSTTPDVCLAPPGYGWAAGGVAGAAAACPRGSYNPGWNREPCVSCGNGTITTDAVGSTTADQCYTPAGHGNRRAAVTGVYEGYVCPLGTYGRPNNTYGLVDVECTKCLENTHTNQEGSTDQGACVTDAGFGYGDGSVTQCQYGYYSPGGNQSPCAYCGDFYNTTGPNVTSATAGVLGATSADECKPDFGWTNDTASGLKPCVRGYYKDTLGWGDCTQCPNATTTTIVYAATQRSDCDACRPGFGGTVDLSAPLCTICGSGTYSFGYVSGGQACAACPNPANFTGKMVSRRGISTPEDCVGEFVNDASMQNWMWWDIIPQLNLQLQNTTDTVIDCQAACSASDRCQYYEFYEYQPAGQRCYLRLAAAAIAKTDIVTTGPSAGNYVLFDIGGGKYSVYLALDGPDADGMGNTLAVNITSLSAATAACDRLSECAGVTFSAASQWRTFTAILWEGAVGRTRTVGETINSWLPEPSAAPT